MASGGGLLLVALSFLMLSCKTVDPDPGGFDSTSGDGYGHAMVRIRFPDSLSASKISSTNDGVALVAIDSAGDTLLSRYWTAADSLTAGYQTGPIAAHESVAFSVSLFRSDTLTHFGADTVDIVAGGHVDVEIVVASMFGTIEVVLVVPADLKASLSRAEISVSAVDLSPAMHVLDLTAQADTVSLQIEGLPAGTDRMVSVRVYNLSGDAVYSGDDTLDVLSGQTIQANLQLSLVGGSANVAVQIQGDGQSTLTVSFPGSASDSIDTAMILVPAGPFLMGEGTDTVTIQLDSFWIEKNEVTNAQFAAFLLATYGVVDSANIEDSINIQSDSIQIAFTGSGIEARAGYENHPVAFVSWYAAEEYCVSRGRELPTDTMWEKAARGTDGRTYPWGETEPDTTLLNYGNKFDGSTQVGRFAAGASPYGVNDMAGNVYEWCNTREEGGSRYVRKGGGWNSTKTYVRSAYSGKDSRTTTSKALGFRCVKRVQ